MKNLLFLKKQFLLFLIFLIFRISHEKSVKKFIITRKTYKTKYLDTISYRKFAIIENNNSMQVEIFCRIDASLVLL